jgi:eukaryotic-like serine/threonine-protein kinase
MTTSVPTITPGEIIAGKFKVERLLGKGGMGYVVQATNVKLGQPVALKFLLPHALESQSIVARFEREARAAAQIQCDHVARVLDVDALPDGSPYMVMEYMEGLDLKKMLREVGHLPVATAVDYVLQACEALAEAHAHGVVHRDLKPANLFVAQRPNGQPVVKVLDFGISKVTLADSDAQLTETSSLMGTPTYMSPEQMASSKDVDARSDIWSVGIVLYELLGGRPPFRGETMPELILTIVNRPHDSLAATGPDIPPGLIAVVDRCLEKQPAKRFANVAELSAALLAFAPPESQSSLQRISHVLGVVPGAPAPLTTRAEGTRESEPGGVPWSQTAHESMMVRRPSPRIVAAAAIAAGLSLGLLVTLLTRSPAPSPPPVAAAQPTPDPPPPPAAPPAPPDSAATAPAAPSTAADTARPASLASPSPRATPPSPATPSPRPPASPRATSAPDCSVPFTVDSKGHRVPRRECL